MTFFLEITAFSEEKVHYQATISSDDLFFREIIKNLGQKLFLITMTLRLKVTISHPPIFMIRFWHANCMARLRGHRTPLMHIYSDIDGIENYVYIYFPYVLY